MTWPGVLVTVQLDRLKTVGSENLCILSGGAACRCLDRLLLWSWRHLEMSCWSPFPSVARDMGPSSRPTSRPFPKLVCVWPCRNLSHALNSWIPTVSFITACIYTHVFSPDCGGFLSAWNGSVVSPYYPAYYPPNVDCNWKIRVSWGQRHSHVPTLHFSVGTCGLWSVFTYRTRLGGWCVWGGRANAPPLRRWPRGQVALLCSSASFEAGWVWFLFQAPLPGYLLSITIVMLDIQDSPTPSSCEKDWLEIGGVKWVSSAYRPVVNSYHAVLKKKKTTFSPSLIPPLTTVV